MIINILRLGEIWRKYRYFFSVKGGIGTDLEGDTHDEDQKKICPGTQRQSWQLVYSLCFQTSCPFPRMSLLCFTTMVPAHQWCLFKCPSHFRSCSQTHLHSHHGPLGNMGCLLIDAQSPCVEIMISLLWVRCLFSTIVHDFDFNS